MDSAIHLLNNWGQIETTPVLENLNLDYWSKYGAKYHLGIQCVIFCTGLLIIHGKKSEISRDLKRQIRGENVRFRGIFAGIFGANFR